MHKLGISVYPDKSPKEEVYAYMEKAAKLGFSRIFTCFLSIPEDTGLPCSEVFPAS